MKDECHYRNNRSKAGPFTYLRLGTTKPLVRVFAPEAKLSSAQTDDTEIVSDNKQEREELSVFCFSLLKSSKTYTAEVSAGLRKAMHVITRIPCSFLGS